MNARKIPDIIIGRLPVYLRALQRMADMGLKTTSSQELGEHVGISAAQIRKDISQFGEFGKQGIGYDVEKLLNQIERILGLNQEWPVGLIGIGHLGEAIARYEGFRRQGIRIAALFDSDPTKIGTDINGLTIQDDTHIERAMREQGVKLAIIAVPATRAQEVADMLVAAGVRAILNYAPMVIQVPENVWVRHIDPVAVLHSMTYYLAREEDKES